LGGAVSSRGTRAGTFSDANRNSLGGGMNSRILQRDRTLLKILTTYRMGVAEGKRVETSRRGGTKKNILVAMATRWESRERKSIIGRDLRGWSWNPESNKKTTGKKIKIY